jgi:hypothetical protein
MYRGAIILALLNYFTLLLSQSQPFYSRAFPTVPKNLPISIINRSDHFYVLRYNRMAHDLTVEKREKPSCEIISFTPLKLDSVNSPLFNYEMLDHLFIEHKNRLHFIFEKSLNNSRTVYLRSIASNGRAEGFLEIDHLEKDHVITDIRFRFFQAAPGKVLIVGEKYYANYTCRKTATLLDLDSHSKIWTYNMPIENERTGYSTSFTCGPANELYFAYVVSHIETFKRKYVNRMQQAVPQFHYDKLSIACITNGSLTSAEVPELQDLMALHGVNLDTQGNLLTLHGFAVAERDSRIGPRLFFLHKTYRSFPDSLVSAELQPAGDEITTALTFYDGEDSDSPADKNYRLYDKRVTGEASSQLYAREDEGFYKELILNVSGPGKVPPRLIPRKVQYFYDRSRYKNIEKVAPVSCEGKVQYLLLEHRSNAGSNPSPFNYHSFRTLGSAENAVLVSYSMNSTGSVEKKVLYRNGDYVTFPVTYNSQGCEYIMYLVKNKIERFAILPLSPE